MKKRLLASLLACGMLLTSCSASAQKSITKTETQLSPKLIDGEYHWIFDVTYTNNTDETLRLLSLEMYDKQGESESRESATVDELVREGFTEDSELLPGETFSLYLTTKTLPIADERTFVLTGRNDDYETFCQVYTFELLEKEKYVPSETEISNTPVPGIGSAIDAIAVCPINGTDWQFISRFMNDTGAPIVFQHVEIVDHLNGQIMGSIILSAEQLGWHDPNIQPDTEFLFEDWHPVADVFDARDYIFTFTDSAGNTLEKAFRFEVYHEGGTAPSGSPAPLPEDNGVRIEGEAVYPNDMDSWHFEPAFINDTGSALTLDHVEVINFMGTEQLDNIPIPVQNLPPDFPTTCAAGQEFRFYDNHPYVPDFNGRVYVFVFRDASGKEIVREFPYALYPGNGEGGNSVPVEFTPWLEDAQTLYLSDAGDWIFPSVFTNDTGSVLHFKNLNIIDTINGADTGNFLLTADQLQGVPLQTAPGEFFSFTDGHPLTDRFNGRRYIFTFTDGSGKEIVREFRFNLSTETEPKLSLADYASDPGRDLQTLRHGADFVVNVYEGVDWVPASALGKSDFSNADIALLRQSSPEDKQKAIDTLYEALQLYQISDFRAADDNVRIFENGVNWEHHKPGYYAVLTNEGCCATDSNWLNYILKDDYEEVGFMATSQPDGSGHIFNYIKQDGYYYFIDLTKYRASDSFSAVESGDLSDYFRFDPLLGNIHRAVSPEAFAAYHVEGISNPPGLIFLYTAEDCLAVDGAREQSGVRIIYGVPDGVNVKVVYDDPRDSMTHTFTEAPEKHFDWASLPHYPF